MSHKKIIIGIFSIIIFVILFYFILPVMAKKEYSIEQVREIAEEVAQKIDLNQNIEQESEKVEHLPAPEAVKAIYMSACVAGTENFRNDLVKLIEETELNSLMIDIKDFSGTISFNTDNPKLLGVNGTGCKAKDLKEFIQVLHDKNIFVIGRITVFQDPYYTKVRPDLAVQKASDGSTWKDYKGISFIDVSAKEYWDYIIELAKESYELGFDEINFDYVRFPSDGNMKDIHFPHSATILESNPVWGKSIALENFFKYLSDELKDTGIITSADLFGMTTTNSDDLNIGQVLEKTLPYFDYVAPMVYPSHYPTGFNGWNNPNTVPYELIAFVMQGAIDKITAMKNDVNTPQAVKDHISNEQLRTWIQDFDYGGDYGPAEVRAQIKASQDVGLDSWMIWAPSNRYTRGALLDQ